MDPGLHRSLGAFQDGGYFFEVQLRLIAEGEKVLVGFLQFFEGAVEGILELPPNYRPGQRVPLVVAIHGGPTTADRYHLQHWIYGRTLLPAKGYAVLCPNYRGSTGRGAEWRHVLVIERDGSLCDVRTEVTPLGLFQR